MLDTHQSQLFIVQVGLVSQVGRFAPAEPMLLRRGDRVICRTARGIEAGRVLSTSGAEQALADGRVLRKFASEDELLWGHLRTLAESTLQQCQRIMDEQSIAATLLEVEPLMDGKTLYFHFLEDSVPQMDAILDSLVEAYEKEVRESKFANLLEHGCGPGCGTDKAVNGCGSKGGCAVCKVASVCKK